MRYARLCIHDQLSPHDFGQHTPESGRCPGGEFLPEDALVIEKENGEWKLPFDFALHGPDGAPVDEQEMFDCIAYALSKLAADQVGEPG